MYYVSICYTVLYYTILYYTILYYNILKYTKALGLPGCLQLPLPTTARPRPPWAALPLRATSDNTIQNNTKQYKTIQLNTKRYITIIQYNTKHIKPTQIQTSDTPSESQERTSKGIGRQGVGSFCKELLCFNTMPCRPMPLPVHFRESNRGSHVYAYTYIYIYICIHMCVYTYT